MERLCGCLQLPSDYNTGSALVLLLLVLLLVMVLAHMHRTRVHRDNPWPGGTSRRVLGRSWDNIETGQTIQRIRRLRKIIGIVKA